MAQAARAAGVMKGKDFAAFINAGESKVKPKQIRHYPKIKRKHRRE